MRLKSILACCLIVASLSSSTFAELAPSPYPNYVAGGIMATIIGLGTGQAINGNWTRTGWIFSVFEGVIGVGLMSVGLALLYTTLKGVYPDMTPTQFSSMTWPAAVSSGQLKPNPQAAASYENNPGLYTTNVAVFSSLTAVGVLFFVAFRVWDIVDAWSTPILSAKGDVSEYGVLEKPTSWLLSPYVDKDVTGLALNF